MARFTYTQEDLLRGTLVEPGWYPVEIYDVEDVTASSSGAAGTKIGFRLIGEGKFKGIPVERAFYESAVGFSKKFLEALGVKLAAGMQFDFDDKLKGKRLEVYIKNNVSNKGNSFNDVVDYRPLGNKVAA